MPGEWAAVPTTDDGRFRMDTPAERIRTACRLLGMVALGLSLGCTFVLIRELIGVHV
jgi:hypothetical protein